ncbi:hypothetical protein ACWCXE_00120 [Streptomyces sp. NPDC001780]|nr:hypothetical protein [Streptomyces sp. NRRL F-5135]
MQFVLDLQGITSAEEVASEHLMISDFSTIFCGWEPVQEPARGAE